LVREAAIPLPNVATATPDERLTALLQRLRPDTGNRALVINEAGHLTGIVTATDLNRLIDVYRLASTGDASHGGTDHPA